MTGPSNGRRHGAATGALTLAVQIMRPPLLVAAGGDPLAARLVDTPNCRALRARMLAHSSAAAAWGTRRSAFMRGHGLR